MTNHLILKQYIFITNSLHIGTILVILILITWDVSLQFCSLCLIHIPTPFDLTVFECVQAAKPVVNYSPLPAFQLKTLPKLPLHPTFTFFLFFFFCFFYFISSPLSHLKLFIPFCNQPPPTWAPILSYHYSHISPNLEVHWLYKGLTSTGCSSPPPKLHSAFSTPTT